MALCPSLDVWNIVFLADSHFEVKNKGDIGKTLTFSDSAFVGRTEILEPLFSFSWSFNVSFPLLLTDRSTM